MKIFIINGSSALFRKNKNKIDEVVKKELGPAHDYEVFSPFWPGVIRRTIRSIKKTKGPIVLIGKSLGGVRVWWLLKKYEDYIHDRDVKVLLIDPHGAQPGDEEACIYGRYADDCLEGPHYVINKGFCVYQRCDWPKGAKWNGGTRGGTWFIENYRIMNTDHYKIINDPETLRLISEVVK